MPNLTKLARVTARGTLVKPLLHQFAMSDAVASINIRVDRPVIRQHDGWFHASQHPLATEFELYQWMTGTSEHEDMSYTARMSVMFGSCAHGIIEAFLAWARIAVPLPEGDCPACGRPYKPLRARPSDRFCTEHGFASEATRARCHLDSILDFRDGPLWGFDFKTIHQFGLKDVRDMDLDSFREKWPGYWAQAQECMRLSGLRRYVFLFMTLGNPWETREFHVPFDPGFAVATEEKYLAVLSHVERKVPIVA